MKTYKLVALLALLLFSPGCKRKSNYEKAMEYYNSMRTTQALLLLKYSNIPREVYLEGKIYLTLNDPRRALKSFEKLIEIAPEWKEKALVDLKKAGEDANRKGKDFTAVLIYNKILEYDPDFELGMKNFLLGDWYFDSQNYDKAIEFYQAGLDYDSLNVEVRLKLAQCFIHNDDLVSSYETLKKGMETNSYWRFKYWVGKVSFQLAKKRYKEGNYNSAELYLGEVISASLPKVLVDDAYFLLGDIRLSQEKYQEAKSCYREVLKINRFAEPKIAREAKDRLRIIENMEKKS
ncbi:MAG: tetratricopeptide repeat protein [candidate division WOR-3 bacterium]|nr:tetratricopeptide repeat protein [candidate division WOR-3 bacterium]